VRAPTDRGRFGRIGQGGSVRHAPAFSLLAMLVTLKREDLVNPHAVPMPA
jgi:hypothetical protein